MSSTTDQPARRPLSDMQLDRIADRMDLIVRRLREIADSVERDKRGIRGDDRIAADPHGVVSNVIHNLNWGLANLNPEMMVTALGDWHALLEAEREQEKQNAIAEAQAGE